ncbi:MAG: hypothetical protein ACFCUU_03660 [Cyclobacteriaceae bacterium]
MKSRDGFSSDEKLKNKIVSNTGSLASRPLRFWEILFGHSLKVF